MVIAVIAFLVVEEPVVADLVGNGMSQLSEFDLWGGKSAVAANLLSLVAQMDSLTARPESLVADEVIATIEPVTAFDQ